MDKFDISQYLVKYGFVIPGNDIYGGKSGVYDYGHIGVLLKKNIQAEWEKYFVLSRDNSYFLDASILTSSQVWEASGHLKNFNDILIDCKGCKRRYREDHLKERICAHCKSRDFTDPREFNLIFRTQEDNYLRPETAQSIFINFRNILKIHNARIPFSVCQVGKAFRNEITLSNFIFRTREFEQMECELFIHPDGSDGYFEGCAREINDFLITKLGLSPEKLRAVEIGEADRAHYSSRSLDMEFLFPHGWGELCGLANRGNFDLGAHSSHSGVELSYLDPISNERYIPHVIEHSMGLNRLMYAIICDALRVIDGDREVLMVPYHLSPYKYCVLPLTKNEEGMARNLFKVLLSRNISCHFMGKNSIGKRYRKCDAMGTFYCITVDADSLNNNDVTIRERDSMGQRRIGVEEFFKTIS